MQTAFKDDCLTVMLLYRATSDCVVTPVLQTVFRVGLALIKTVETELLRVDFEKLLGALNAKWFPAFARGPDELLRVALRIKVSGRLKRYKARYQQQEREPA